MNNKIEKLIIKLKDGTIIDEGFMNEKGYKKSIERGELWVVHGETGRLLPYAEGSSFLSITYSQSGYEAHVENTFIAKSVKNCGKPVEKVDNSLNNEEKMNKLNTSQKNGQVLQALSEVIKQRHEEMPEGSYTTHLFKSGGEKIRKKTGEEAIELILATEKSEITYEAADLIYHLMVLLESEGISISQVMAELEKR